MLNLLLVLTNQRRPFPRALAALFLAWITDIDKLPCSSKRLAFSFQLTAQYLQAVSVTIDCTILKLQISFTGVAGNQKEKKKDKRWLHNEQKLKSNTANLSAGCMSKWLPKIIKRNPLYYLKCSHNECRCDSIWSTNAFVLTCLPFEHDYISVMWYLAS